MASSSQETHTNRATMWVVLGICALFSAIVILISCSSSDQMTPTVRMASATVSISDPPSCKVPSGSFEHVYISIRSVQAHTSASAGDNSPGWVELAPQLNTQPMQVDLLGLPTNGCFLAMLGSTSSLPPGDYQQIRLLLVSNTPGSSPAPATNNCGNFGFNCVVLNMGTTSTTEELDLSSQANTGLKIPPGQVVGGPIHVAPGANVDLNIDFNVCLSLVDEGNGMFRLKPTLTAGQVSTTTTGISGQATDSVSGMAIVGGTTLVALEQPDANGVDRIFMQAAADGSGNFNFCPLPTGATFDVVIVAINGAGVAYNAAVVVNVMGGSALGKIPLIAETGAATGPGTIQGFDTALKGPGAGAMVDVSMSALQTIALSGGGMRQVTIPLEGASTPLVSITAATTCPAGAPMGANCVQYTLILPASNPEVGTFSAGTITFTAPAAGPVLYTVEADAALPMMGTMTGGPDCTPATLPQNMNTGGMPLAVTAGATTNAKEIDFSGCM